MDEVEPDRRPMSEVLREAEKRANALSNDDLHGRGSAHEAMEEHRRSVEEARRQKANTILQTDTAIDALADAVRAIEERLTIHDERIVRASKSAAESAEMVERMSKWSFEIANEVNEIRDRVGLLALSRMAPFEQPVTEEAAGSLNEEILLAANQVWKVAGKGAIHVTDFGGSDDLVGFFVPADLINELGAALSRWSG